MLKVGKPPSTKKGAKKRAVVDPELEGREATVWVPVTSLLGPFVGPTRVDQRSLGTVRSSDAVSMHR